MKRTLSTVLFCLAFGLVFSQQQGDYQSDQNGNWSTATTWEVFFNGAWRDLETVAAGSFQNVIPSALSGFITVRHAVLVNNNTTANQIVVNATGVLTIRNSRSLTVQDDGVNTPLQIIAGGSLVNDVGTLALPTGATAVPCQVFGTLSSSGTILTSNSSLLIFHPASTYVHLNGTGGNIPLATWDISSTCRISGLTRGNAAAPGNLGQTFGNFVFEGLTAGYSPAFHLGSALHNVQGNLTIITTGTNALRFGNGGSGLNLTVGGNFTIQGGIVILAQSLSTTSTLTVGGNLVMSGGTLRLGTSNNSPINLLLNGNFVKTGGTLLRGTGSGAGAIRFDGAIQTYANNANITDVVHFSVQSGSTLNLGTSFLTGTGSFTLFSGGTLNVGSTDAGGAIQLGAVGGNIRMSGARTYQTGSTIVYNGAATQYMGNGHPANPNTTISNGVAVYMVASVTINGVLDLIDPLVIDNNTLTLGGSISEGYLGIIPQSNVIINGTGDFGTLVLAPVQSPSPPNAMNNLTINRNGTVTLGRELIVGGTFRQTNGTFVLGVTPGWQLTLRGPFIQTGGSIFNDDPLFIVEGTGAMPANINFTGTGFEKLTMNRAGGTFSTTAPVTITDSLNLLNGTVSHPLSNMTMGTGATVMRTLGSITQVLGAITSYEVVYAGSTNITTGNELPFITPVTTRLSNLRKLGTNTVALNHDIIVNGNFTIENGTFDVATGNDVGIGGNLVVDGAFLTQQSNVAFLGSGPQTISGAASPIAFFDLTVAQVASTTLGLSTNITVASNLAITSGSTFNVGTNRMRLLSTPTRTANVNALPVGASIVGSVIVDRYLPKANPVAGYFHMASPVVSSTVTDWRNEVSFINAAYRYNEPTAAFVPYSLSGSLQSGVGYFIYINNTGTFTPDLRGTLRQGNFSVPVTSQSTNPARKGFNLVGNPYPSAISWSNIVLPGNGSINNAVYVTDNFNNSGQGTATHSVSFVDGVSTPAGFVGEIAQGQAFWILANANSTLNFTEAAKITTTNTQFYRQGEIPDVLRISLEGMGEKSETVLRLREGATQKFDSKFDAQTFFEPDLSLSTLTTDNVNTVINAFSLDNCVGSIPLVPVVPKGGSYTLSFQGLDSFDAGLTITLADTEENKIIDVQKINEYRFTVSDHKLANLANRFRISFQGKGMTSAPGVALTVEGTTLVSSAADGNQWYFNDVLLEGETSEKLVAFDPGIYSVKITQGGCTSEASHEVSEEDLNIYPAISIYPNPTRDKIWTRVKSENNNISAVLVNSAGMEIETKQLVGEGNVKEGEFDLIPHASGIYYLKILDGTKMFIRKVAKIK
jgi:hypothetical protein